MRVSTTRVTIFFPLVLLEPRVFQVWVTEIDDPGLQADLTAKNFAVDTQVMIMCLRHRLPAAGEVT